MDLNRGIFFLWVLFEDFFRELFEIRQRKGRDCRGVWLILRTTSRGGEGIVRERKREILS